MPEEEKTKKINDELATEIPANFWGISLENIKKLGFALAFNKFANIPEK